MKQSYSSLRQLFIMLLLALIVMPAKAQYTGDPFEVNVELVTKNMAYSEDKPENKEKRYAPRAFMYGLIETVPKAQELLRTAEKKASEMSDAQIIKYLAGNEVSITVGAASQGRFKTSKVLPGMAILVFIPLGGVGKVIPITGEKTIKATIEYQIFESAKVIGYQKNGREIKPEPPENDGDSVTFTVDYKLDAKWCKEDTRLIIQMYMIDCNTEDTVAFCPPIVSEGQFYHDLQDKRMSYDYNQNDPIGHGFDENEMIRPNEEFHLVRSVKMRKPDIKRNYKAPYDVSVEDYHHVYFKESIEGTCLQIEPFKLLDFTPALGELELTDEFQTPAQSQFGNTTQELNLRYEVGKYEYIDDSLNNALLDSIVAELNSYGDYLVNYDIEGFASPDGSYETNRTLAQRRGANAAQAISRRISAKVRQPRISVTVCTWEDVVSELKRRGKVETAEAVQNIIDSRNGAVVFSAIKQLPDYDDVIVPVLESQRKMRCSIMFRRAHVLSGKEVVEQYYKNKTLPAMDRWKFSEGDYFNLLSNVTDSAELDTITIMAYELCKNSKDYLTLKLSPYVTNRMAMVMIKRGKPDKSILDPYLDYSTTKVGFTRCPDDINCYVVNRKEHILNQAVAYYMEEKLDTARYWLEMIKAQNMKGAKALDQIILLRKNYKKENRLSGSALAEYLAAKDFVLNSNKENKAILYTEIEKWGKRAEAEDYVNMLDDDNPKKWYLKGILWADEKKIKSAANAAAEELGQDDLIGGNVVTKFEVLSDEQLSQLTDAQKLLYEEKLARWNERNKIESISTVADDTVSVKDIPNYLAYFQHSFDMNPSLKKFYYNEGHVGPKLRRTYKYKFAKIPAYHKLFRRLKVNDDLAKEALAGERVEELE